MAYKVKSVLSVYTLVVFKILFVFMIRKSNAKFLLASLKTLTNFLNPPVTPQFRNPPVTVKLAPDPAGILKIVP
jgi:hypothetical protein